MSCFLVCFAIDKADSLDNVRYKWMNELKDHANSSSKYILVGTKSDFREQKSTCIADTTIQEFVETYASGSQPFYAYVETSALKRIKVNDPFHRAIE